MLKSPRCVILYLVPGILFVRVTSLCRLSARTVAETLLEALVRQNLKPSSQTPRKVSIHLLIVLSGETMRFLSKTKTEFDLGDFAVGNSITLFKRTFFITSCDQFTRSFYANRLGIDLAPNVTPVPIQDIQPQREEPLQSLVPKVPRKTSEQIRREIDYAGVKVRS